MRLAFLRKHLPIDISRILVSLLAMRQMERRSSSNMEHAHVRSHTFSSFSRRPMGIWKYVMRLCHSNTTIHQRCILSNVVCAEEILISGFPEDIHGFNEVDSTLLKAVY